MLRLRDASRALEADLLVGAPRRAAVGSSRNAMVLLRRGRSAGVEDKLELMPFSERSVGAGPLRLGRDAYAAGEALRLLESGGLRIGVAICSEAMGPEFLRRAAAAGATLFVNPSNDYWFTSPEAARQQLAKARLRAVESRRFLVRATSTGYSAIVDPRGDLVARSGFGGAEWLAAEVRGSDAASFHERAGWAFGPGALALACLAALPRRSSARPHPGHGESRP
jgi:apolipoprotein N-acyltransferase